MTFFFDVILFPLVFFFLFSLLFGSQQNRFIHMHDEEYKESICYAIIKNERKKERKRKDREEVGYRQKRNIRCLLTSHDYSFVSISISISQSFMNQTALDAVVGSFVSASLLTTILFIDSTSLSAFVTGIHVDTRYLNNRSSRGT